MGLCNLKNSVNQQVQFVLYFPIFFVLSNRDQGRLVIWGNKYLHCASLILLKLINCTVCEPKYMNMPPLNYTIITLGPNQNYHYITTTILSSSLHHHNCRHLCEQKGTSCHKFAVGLSPCSHQAECHESLCFIHKLDASFSNNMLHVCIYLPRRKFVHEVMNFHGLFTNVHENA